MTGWKASTKNTKVGVKSIGGGDRILFRGRYNKNKEFN